MFGQLLPDVMHWSQSHQIDWSRVLRRWITAMATMMSKQVMNKRVIRTSVSIDCGVFSSLRVMVPYFHWFYPLYQAINTYCCHYHLQQIVKSSPVFYPSVSDISRWISYQQSRIWVILQRISVYWSLQISHHLAFSTFLIFVACEFSSCWSDDWN